MRSFRDTRAGVFDAQVRTAKVHAAADGNGPTAWCIAKCVVEEIIEQLPEQRHVSSDLRVLEHEAEIDVACNRALHPFVDRAVRNRVEIDRRGASRFVSSRFGLGEDQELIGEMARTHGRQVHVRDLAVDLGVELATQQQLEMHLQSGERGAQLVRGVSQKALLHFIRLPELGEEPVQRLDRRRDFVGRRVLVQRVEIVRRAAEELRSHRRERCESARDARPGDDECRGRDEQCRKQPRGEDFPDQAISLVKRFRDLHIQPVTRSHGRHAHRLASIAAVEERTLAWLEIRRQLEVFIAGDDRTARCANLEDQRVLVIVEQRFLGLLEQREARSIGIHPHVGRHVQRRVQQRAVVRRRSHVQRDEIRQRRCAQDQQQQRRNQEQQQPPANASPVAETAKEPHPSFPTGSRSRARCGCARLRLRFSSAAVTRRPRSHWG